jgi:hypothetical protein
MTSQPALTAGPTTQKPTALASLLTPREAAKLLKVGLSWLAKARMRGGRPSFLRSGDRPLLDEKRQ